MFKASLSTIALVMTSASAALAHQTGIQHSHPHDAWAFTTSEFVVAALLALAVALIVGARFFLSQPRKSPARQRGKR